MTEQSQPTNPAEEMVKFWQAWMTVGMDAMQRTAMLFAPRSGPPEWTTGVREQMEKTVRAALEAARIPSAQDLGRVVQGLEAIRSTVETMQAGMAALESLVKTQQAMWQALEASVHQATRGQEEMQKTMAAWSSQWEDRLAGLTRGWEEWRQRWDEMLHQGMAMSQASQKSIEDLTKTMWDISQKVMGGQS